MSTITYRDYADILATIQTVAPEAHIAGGAVRDDHVGHEPHDVDIFLAAAGNGEDWLDKEKGDACAKLLRAKHGYVPIGKFEAYAGFSDPVLKGVIRCERADSIIPVCLIGIAEAFADPERNIARFDYGICQIAWDGKRVIRTEEFNADANSRTFTLLRADNIEQFTYSMTRFQKISAGRYAGWKLAVPLEFKDLAAEYAMRRAWFRDDNYGDLEDGTFGIIGPSRLRPKERQIPITQFDA